MFTYNTTTVIGKVRMLIHDTAADRHVFEDEEVTTFLELEGGRIKRAAALALETMASNEAFVLKAIRLLELTTDGPKVSAELRARAKDLREQDAAELAIEDAAAGSGFAIAEWYLGPASMRDYLARGGMGDE